MLATFDEGKPVYSLLIPTILPPFLTAIWPVTPAFIHITVQTTLELENVWGYPN
jgi:hypothetical protein